MIKGKGRREHGFPGFDRGAPIEEPKFNEENIRSISFETGLSTDEIKEIITAEPRGSDDPSRSARSL